MNILITGNMGYIGPVVVKHLRSCCPGVKLIGLDMGYFAACLTNADVLPECQVDVQHFGDVRHLSSCVLESVQGIVHLAGISNDPIGNAFEEVTFDINWKASIELAKKAKRAGVRHFVFASSCSMYGAADDGARTEDSPLNPLTAYAKSKVYTERDLKGLAEDSFIVTCLRFSTACGMSPRLRLDLVLNDFVAGAVATNKITILSDGTPWRPLIDVRDMARSIEWAIMRDTTNGGSYLAVNVGTDEWNYQVRDLADAVAGIIPEVTVTINEDAQPDKRSYRVCFDLFEQVAPDHQPRFDLASSITELWKGLKEMGFNDASFRDSHFMRLKVLNELCDRKVLTSDLHWAGDQRYAARETSHGNS